MQEQFWLPDLFYFLWTETKSPCAVKLNLCESFLHFELCYSCMFFMTPFFTFSNLTYFHFFVLYLYLCKKFYVRTFGLILTEVRSKRRSLLPLVFTSNNRCRGFLKIWPSRDWHFSEKTCFRFDTDVWCCVTKSFCFCFGISFKHGVPLCQFDFW